MSLKSGKRKFLFGLFALVFLAGIIFIPLASHADPEGDLRAFLLARIEALKAQIVALQAQIIVMQSTNQSGGIPTGFAFTRNLTLGSEGSEVVILQTWLANNNYLVIPPGIAKGYFGGLTREAVASWQRRVGISPAVGYFGPLSRSRLNSTIGATLSTQPLPPEPEPQQQQQFGFSASCNPSVSQTQTGVAVTWSATVTGGPVGTSYTYSWQGIDGLSGTSQVVQKTYHAAGMKTAKVSVNSKPFVQCSGSVNVTLEPQTLPVTSGQWPVPGLSPAPIYAFGYQDQNYTYLTRMRWLVESGSMVNMQEALHIMNSMPPGRRAFSSLNAHEILDKHPSDRCIAPESGGTGGGTPNPSTGGGDADGNGSPEPNPPTGGGSGSGGGFTNFPCPWWNNGAAEVRQKFANFAQAFRAAGGSIDYLILDSEQWFQNWNITSQAHAEAIQNDHRFSSLKSQMEGNYNFGPTGINIVNTIYRWGQFATPQPDARDNYLKWNAFMLPRTAGYISQAVFDPIRSQFPSVRASDYELQYHNQSYQVPNFNGHRVHAYGNGAIVGTHQSVSAYGRLNEISTNPSRSPLPGIQYAADAFNAFKYDVNSVRSMRLSSGAPISVWFSERSWAGDSGSPAYYRGSDYYAENIFHAGLTTKPEDFFILWNRGAVHNLNDDILFEKILSELNNTVGFSGRQPIVTGLVPWDANAIYTGSRVGDYKIWRYTPRLNPGQNISQYVTNSGSGDFTQPVVVNAAGRVATFPEAFIYSPIDKASNSGVWIIQRATAANPTLAIERERSFLAAVFEAVTGFFERVIKAVVGR